MHWICEHAIESQMNVNLLHSDASVCCLQKSETDLVAMHLIMHESDLCGAL